MLSCGLAVSEENAKAMPTTQPSAWGDQSDGTFVNPILPADYSDIDCIRVGDDFYAISSTFQYSPGMVILHSTDLVNWRIVSHAIDDVTQISPELNWDKMNRYGRGVWAGAIRHHAGRFWIYFGTPDEGFFVTSAPSITGPWDKLTHIMKEKGWDDCCPFWDDDGQGYFVCTHFADGYKIHLFKLTPDNKGLVPDSGKVIHQSKGSEANKLYKFDGMYYHFFSEVKPEGRVTMMARSKTIDGPREVRQLNHVNSKVDREPNQGGFVQLPEGKWWFLTHQGSGAWEGRTMCLLPVEWREGWPIIGKPGPDGIGNMVWRSDKPIPASAKIWPAMSDAFDGQQLALQWEWNYQPRADKWSLAARPGFLRLSAVKPIKPGDLLKAGNTLTQRIFRSASGVATLKLDIAGLAPGQRAGLCHLSQNYSMLAIEQRGDKRLISVQTRRGPQQEAALPEGNIVWLRTTWHYDGSSQYSWSADGAHFTDIGDKNALTWSHYRGDRLGIFSFNDEADAGHVDVDSFECELR